MSTSEAHRREQSIARHMEAKGLPYELEHPGNVYHAIASAGNQYVVMAHTYHEDTKKVAQYFCGYYPGYPEARIAQRGILEATPRKRFVQSVIVVKGS